MSEAIQVARVCSSPPSPAARSRQATLGRKPHPVTYKFNGTAILESGPNKGNVDKFTASDTKPNNPLFLTIRFRLK